MPRSALKKDLEVEYLANYLITNGLDGAKSTIQDGRIKSNTKEIKDDGIDIESLKKRMLLADFKKGKEIKPISAKRLIGSFLPKLNMNAALGPIMPPMTLYNTSSGKSVTPPISKHCAFAKCVHHLGPPSDKRGFTCGLCHTYFCSPKCAKDDWDNGEHSIFCRVNRFRYGIDKFVGSMKNYDSIFMKESEIESLFLETKEGRNSKKVTDGIYMKLKKEGDTTTFDYYKSLYKQNHVKLQKNYDFPCLMKVSPKLNE